MDKRRSLEGAAWTDGADMVRGREVVDDEGTVKGHGRMQKRQGLYHRGCMGHVCMGEGARGAGIQVTMAQINVPMGGAGA